MDKNKDIYWINTYMGVEFSLTDLTEEQILIEDVSHALSNLCRFSGHSKSFYSVAQHSVIISEIVPEKDALWGLLHDSAEAYISDIPRPLKYLMGENVKKLESDILKLVCRKFGLSEEMPDSVKLADDKMLVTEMWCLMNMKQSWLPLRQTTPYHFNIVPVYPEKAKELFMMRFRELVK